MDFNLSEEQLLLQKTVREFTKQELEPAAEETDRLGRLPDDLLEKMAQVNLAGMILPPEYGGSGSSCLDCVLALEQIGYSGTGAWWLAAFTNSIPECIAQFGTKDQKKQYLPDVCKGKIYPSILFTEAETGSDPDALETSARYESGHYIINGMKRFSTFGARNGFAITYAKDEDDCCRAFITDKNALGYSAGSEYKLMGAGGIETADVYLDNVKVPEENVLGDKEEGFSILLHWIAHEKIQQSASCLGIAQAALDEAKQFSKSRIVKKRPQAGLLNIRSMLADMYARLEAARWLTYRAAFLKDEGHSDWMLEAAAAKVYAVPAAMEVVEISRRIHGAYGYTKDFKIERLFRAVAGASAIAVSLEINRSIVSSALIR